MGMEETALSRRGVLLRTASSMAAVACNALPGVKGSDSVSQAIASGRLGTKATRQQAANDYTTSLQAFGGRLSSPIDSLFRASCDQSTPCHFDVVVIGSGYGASICAARISAKLRPGAKLAVIERGKEWVPGTFPDRFPGLAKEAQRALLGLDKRTVRNPTGLLNVLQNDDVTIMSSCGLGGTSLINANVAIRPDVEVFQQPPWPTELSDRSFLDPYYDRAEWELGTRVEPIDLTNKMRAQRLAAERLRDYGAHFEASALTITRGPQLGMAILNRQGMIQRPCTSCGDCMTGCNVGAKNTLAMNYLPIARINGAEIFTETEIERIEKRDGLYVVHYVHHAQQGSQFVPMRGSLRCRILILGAGSIGSTEILLRSQSQELQFSPNLGCRWSGNGDILGFVRGVDVCTNIRGTGAQVKVDQLIGPTIQSNVTYPNRPHLHHRVIVQDGGAASAYGLFVSIFGRDIGLDHTQVVLVSGHDGSHGRIELGGDGKAVVRWPNLYHHPYRKMAEEEIRRFATALGGEYQELLAFKGRVGTVHPLGGCSIASDPSVGVINGKGQVFDMRMGGDFDPSTQSCRVHEGLYVADGASIPTSLGVNPFLTISALAERTAEYITLEPAFADLFAL